MKKIISGAIVLSLCLSVVGCSSKTSQNKTDTKPKSSVEQQVQEDKPVKNLDIDFEKMYTDEETRSYAKEFIGKKAPDFTLKNLKGESVQLSSFKGQNVILEFASSSCPECKNTAIEVQSFEEKNKDVKILRVFPRDAQDDVKAFFKQSKTNEDLNSIPAKESLDKNTLVKDYDIKFVPSFIFIDKNGFIPFIHIGGVNEKNLTEMKHLCFDDISTTKQDDSKDSNKESKEDNKATQSSTSEKGQTTNK